MTSTLRIDGATTQGDIVAIATAYTAAMEIITSGKPRSLTLEGMGPNGRVKVVFFVTQHSTVSVELEDEPGALGADTVYNAFTPNAETIINDANEKFRAENPTD